MGSSIPAGVRPKSRLGGKDRCEPARARATDRRPFRLQSGTTPGLAVIGDGDGGAGRAAIGRLVRTDMGGLTGTGGAPHSVLREPVVVCVTP